MTISQLVAVGSTRRPKLEAVREALALWEPCLGGLQFDVVAVEVHSGVRHTPLSRDETMAGARQRAEALVHMARERKEAWKYFVGLEGGLEVVAHDGGRWVFLQNWAYASDGNFGSYGQSGGILLPDVLAQKVVDEGIELSEAIDAFAGGHRTRDRQGAWGILTGGLITRQDAFRTAVVNALAPLINRATYAGRRREPPVEQQELSQARRPPSW
jgi:inosine/xanthosine triphosphatase